MQARTRTIGPESRKGHLDLGLAEVAVAGVVYSGFAFICWHGICPTFCSSSLGSSKSLRS